MDVLILLLFVSLVLVVGALILFAKGLFQGDFDHGDRLALLPLEEDDEGSPRDPTIGGPRSARRAG